MNAGPALGGLSILAGAAIVYAVIAWLALYVSSVVTDTGPVARSYPRAAMFSTAIGIVWSPGWFAIQAWLHAGMMVSVAAAAVALVTAMTLLGIVLSRRRQSLR